MKRRLAAFLLAVGVLIPTLSSLSFAQVPRVRVGVVIDGPWERNDEISENTRSLQGQVLCVCRRMSFHVRRISEARCWPEECRECQGWKSFLKRYGR